MIIKYFSLIKVFHLEVLLIEVEPFYSHLIREFILLIYFYLILFIEIV